MTRLIQSLLKTDAPKGILLAALLAIGAIRLLPFLVWSDNLQQDPDAYASLAIGWGATGTYGNHQESSDAVAPTAYRPPLYPWLLKHFVVSNAVEPRGTARLLLIPVAILHWILGVTTCTFVIRITSSIRDFVGGFRNERLATYMPLLAGVATACDPILLRQSSLVMTETLATFLAVAFWLWFVHSCGSHRTRSLLNTMLGGFLLGLSILCRPTAAVWALIIFTCLLWQPQQPSDSQFRKWIKTIGFVSVLAITALCTIAPWTIRNYLTFGKPIWATTHGGYTLLLANNPIIYEHFQKVGVGRNWDEGTFHARWNERSRNDKTLDNLWEPDTVSTPELWYIGHKHLDDDQYASQAAWKTIRENPGTFIYSCFIRIGWLWVPWPASSQASLWQQILIGMWYFGWYVILMVTLVQIWRAGLNLQKLWLMIPGITLILTLTLVHSVYWSNMRMRSVAMPAIYVLALVIPGRRVEPNHRGESAELNQ